MPKISVIVPVFKVEPYIEKCIKSLVDQTFGDFELLLVDDGSPDNCGAICDEWAQKDNRIIVFHKENGGLSDARNYGIDRAKGEYLCFVDSDDYVKDTYLEYLMSLFSLSDDCNVVACNHYIVRGENLEPNSAFFEKEVLDRKSAFTSVLYHEIIDVSAWGKLYKRQVFETLRFPKARLFEDTYVFGDVLNSTNNMVFGGEPQYYYVQRESSIVNSAFNEKKLEFIDSVDRLIDAAKKCDMNFDVALTRRYTHARLSVLRYMKDCDKAFLQLRKKIRKEALQNKWVILKDKRASKRDKISILALMLGLKFFFFAWGLYQRRR